MLHRSIVLLRGQADVADRHIVLQIHELFAGHTGHMRGRQRSSGAAYRRRRRATPGGERRPQLRRVLDHRVAREDARAGAGTPQPGRRAVGHEHG